MGKLTASEPFFSFLMETGRPPVGYIRMLYHLEIKADGGIDAEARFKVAPLGRNPERAYHSLV